MWVFSTKKEVMSLLGYLDVPANALIGLVLVNKNKTNQCIRWHVQIASSRPPSKVRRTTAARRGERILIN